MPIPDAVAGPEPLDEIDPDAALVQEIANRALMGLIENAGDNEGRGKVLAEYERELKGVTKE